MRYDFDTVIDRRGTASVKWDFAEKLFGVQDIIPMWVADMDFASPPEVVEAVVERAKHGVFGYTACTPEYFDAVTGWMGRRHGWAVEKEWIVFSPGVVPALHLLVQAFTKPGDRVILQTPVYYPFMMAVERNGREVLRNPLVLENGRYRMDFRDLERKAADPLASLLILCSPHNPVGRLWTADELRRLGDICAVNGVTVIADEIHGDLVLGGRRHVPYAALSPAFLAGSVTCTAPSKTFNLPGLQTSNVIIADPEKRAAFKAALERSGIYEPNAFGVAALTAAYERGEEWLGALLSYIGENLEFLAGFVDERLPGIRVIEPEATYLAWLDCRGLGMDRRELRRFMREKARVAFDEGYIFGSPEGDGFERINMACPRSVLKEGLERIEKALRERGA